MDRHVGVLAVGIDSAEPSLVRTLIDRGDLPALAGLTERGSWGEVDSGAELGSGAVWPTFFTGTRPAGHGMCNEWIWDPDAMACTDARSGLAGRPFWSALDDEGRAVGALDVPYAPAAGVARGFEIGEWGPHDVVDGVTRATPDAARELLAAAPGHPFARMLRRPGRFEDHDERTGLSRACFAGADARGELALRLIAAGSLDVAVIAFTEVHHVTHQLWHTIEPDHRQYADPRFEAALRVEPGLVDLYREVDRQIARIVDAVGPDTPTVAFSLHGMRPGVGIPMAHEPVLEALGLARPATWRGLSWRERGTALLGAAKRRAPASLKALYWRATSQAARQRLAQPTIVAPHDWSRTQAFALPTDQHGYIRVNLRGREAAGIVDEDRYPATCGRIEAALRELTDASGDPLVAGIVRTADDGGPPAHLPDLVIRWADAAFARPLRVRVGSREVVSDPIRPDLTGQHTDRGFCIVDGRLADRPADVVGGEELHRMLLTGIGSRPVGARS